MLTPAVTTGACGSKVNARLLPSMAVHCAVDGQAIRPRGSPGISNGTGAAGALGL
jgi:hypothetical protein